MLSSTPSFDAIRPDADLATLTFTAFLQGKPLSRGHLALQVSAPPRAKILTTDFPWVEGTSLLDLRSALQEDGTFTVQYIFPIRGEYRFDVELTSVPGGPAFPPTRTSQRLHISENPTEVSYAWLLVLALFALGMIVGVIFARSAAARDALPDRAQVVFWALFGLLLCASCPVQANPEHGAASPGQHGPQVVQGEDGWELEVRPQPSSATVGQLLELTIVLKKDGVVAAGADLLLVVSSQENDQEMLRTSLHLPTGQTTQRLQIFDGAPHTITVTAHPAPAPAPQDAVAPLTVALGVDVQALHPPMAIKLRILGLFIGILLLGMAVGFFFPRASKGLAGA